MPSQGQGRDSIAWLFRIPESGPDQRNQGNHSFMPLSLLFQFFKSKFSEIASSISLCRNPAFVNASLVIFPLACLTVPSLVCSLVDTTTIAATYPTTQSLRSDRSFEFE